MQRRDFLKTLALGSVAANFPLLTQPAHAANASLSFPLVVNTYAYGAWDAPSFCDPKGAPMNPYALSDVRQFGNLRVAPLVPQAITFFSNNYAKLTVINGITTTDSNSHQSSVRIANAGDMLETGTYPAFPALVAAARGQELGLSYISETDGYGNTNGEVAETFATSGLIQALLGASKPSMLTSSVSNTVNQAIAARLARRLSAGHLTSSRKSMALLQAARLGSADFAAVNATLQDVIANVPVTEPVVDNGQMILALQMGLVGYKHGLTVAVNASMDAGFDTHANHDALHYTLLDGFFGALNYMDRLAQYLGIADQIILLGLSEFGRTPMYNNQAGKDHWPVTSHFFKGPGVPGNRLIQATDDNNNALKVNPNTLQLDDQGVLMGHDHVHEALRRLVGLDQHPLALKYPVVPDRPLALFG